jgi:hypothetical protein
LISKLFDCAIPLKEKRSNIWPGRNFLITFTKGFCTILEEEQEDWTAGKKHEKILMMSHELMAITTTITRYES